MIKENKNEGNLLLPKGLIIFISGVPGVGKTTISYKLLKNYNDFRIIEETDLIRETLRGYNNYLRFEFGEQVDFLLERVKITDHTKLLTFNEAKKQCEIMKNSLEQIVARQQRKGISTIINGVHIIPETLNGIAENSNIIYFNLYVTDEDEIRKRILSRDPSSYMLEHISFIFETNKNLYLSTEKISSKYYHIFNIDVTNLNIDETMDRILLCLNDTLKKSI